MVARGGGRPGGRERGEEVGGVEAASDLGGEGAGGALGEGALREEGGEVRAGEGLHDEVAAAVREAAEVADLGDVGVAEAGHDLGLAEEALLEGGVGGREDLEMDGLVEEGVVGVEGEAVWGVGDEGFEGVAAVEGAAEEVVGVLGHPGPVFHGVGSAVQASLREQRQRLVRGEGAGRDADQGQQAGAGHEGWPPTGRQGAPGESPGRRGWMLLGWNG
jgi:hypothetical protein